MNPEDLENLKKEVEELKRQTDATKQETITQLQKELEELKSKQASFSPKVEVSIPPSRKVCKFNGKDSDVRDWIEDAKGAIRGLPVQDQMAFLKRNLDGDARKEINLQQDSLKKPDDVFMVLKDTFGERRSAAKIKRAVYDRMQGEDETVRDFTRSLMDLVDRLPRESVQSKNKILTEVILDNLKSKPIRDNLAEMVERDPDTPFTDLRARAIRLGDLDSDPPKRDVKVKSLTEETSSTPSVSSDTLAGLSSAMEQLMKSQVQVLSLLQQQATANAVHPEPRVNQAADPRSTPFPPSQNFSHSSQPDMWKMGYQHWGDPSQICQVTPGISGPSFGMHGHQVGGPRPLATVQCYKCKNFGHIQSSAQCPLYRSRQHSNRSRGRGRRSGQTSSQDSGAISNQGNEKSPMQ